MNQHNLKEYQLDNGLKLEFIDQSKKIAGNKMYICILIRIVIPVERKWFSKTSLIKTNFSQLINVLGHQVVFEQKQERHFVEITSKNNYIDSIISNVINLSSKYFGLHKFPEKFILKCFHEKK